MSLVINYPSTLMKELDETRSQSFGRWASEYTFASDDERDRALAIDEALSQLAFVDAKDLNAARYAARAWKLADKDVLPALVERINKARTKFAEGFTKRLSLK